jgi:hypothetical protein
MAHIKPGLGQGCQVSGVRKQITDKCKQKTEDRRQITEDKNRY